MRASQKFRFKQGFSSFEALLVVAILGVMATVCVAIYQNVSLSTKQAKLDSDLATLNSAMQSYLLFGGKLTGNESLEAVLTKLRSKASVETAQQVVGLAGAFLDPRFQAVMQTEAEASSDEQRIYWNSPKHKFESATSGPVGIKEFRINYEYVEPENGLVESRETILDYAHESNWIWDYQEAAPALQLQPTKVALYSVEETTSVDTYVSPVSTTLPEPPPASPPGSGPVVLSPPTFSIPPGTHPISDFTITVEIIDPNPTGSKIKYSKNHGPWNDYAGTGISIDPGEILSAQALPVESSGDYLFSTVTEGIYAASPEDLTPPIINLSEAAFNPPAVNTITAHLVNPNDPTVSRVDYRLGGGPWITYAGGDFQINSASYPLGVTIEAYAVSSSTYWNDSTISSSGIVSSAPSLEFTISVSRSP